MHRLRNRAIVLLLAIVSVINAAVLVINPQQLNSVIEEQSVRCLLSRPEGLIEASYKNELITPDQNFTLYEFKSETRASSQPVPRFLQPFHSAAPTIAVIFYKPGSGHFANSTKPEFNGVELFLLHRRLNT
jgi:hypothetical protein